MSVFDYPSTNRTADEMSTESVTGEQEVHDGDRLIGETAHQDSTVAARTGYVARNAHYAEYGDAPGRVAGWVGPWRTREEAEEALRWLTTGSSEK